jgi:hypothetical protein
LKISCYNWKSASFFAIKWNIDGIMDSYRDIWKREKTFENIIASHPTTQDNSDSPIACLTIITKIEKK